MSNTVLVTPQADAKPKRDWHDFIAEYLVLAMIGVSVADITVLMEVKEAINHSTDVVDRQIQTIHIASKVTERALSRLEGEQAAPHIESFRLEETLEPEVLKLSE